MGRVTQDDYLTVAQGLAVGMNTRVPHRGDRTNRPNLVVYNDGDKWSAYCMSCHHGHKTMKTHVRIIEAPAESKLPDLPYDRVALDTLPAWRQEQIAHFLARKHMDLTYLPDCTYSQSRERLIIETPQGFSGRDLTEKSDRKWLIYSRTHFMGWPSSIRINILVEDLFSMWKVDYALRHSGLAWYATVVCTLGTGLGPGAMAELAACHRAIFMYDGDKAGWAGARSQAKRLRAMGLTVAEACAPEGLDPKDMEIGEIINHVRGTLGFANTQGPI